MDASKCRHYAEQCLQLARQLEPHHRALLLGLADEWREVADELEVSEEQAAQGDRFSNKQKNGN
jgi:hypothetical protein